MLKLIELGCDLDGCEEGNFTIEYSPAEIPVDVPDSCKLPNTGDVTVRNPFRLVGRKGDKCMVGEVNGVPSVLSVYHYSLPAQLGEMPNE